MSKKKNRQAQQTEKKPAENYYKLKTEAVEKLVNAKDAPEVSDEEIRKYKSGGKFRIPGWLKILFVKFWFGGAICFFFMWGLGNYLAGIDKLAVIAIGMGLVTDLMINHIIRACEPEKGVYDKWMMVSVRKWWSIILNVIYAGVILVCIVYTYTAINYLLYGPAGTSDKIFGVEPLLFGVLFCAYDMLFIGIKTMLRRIVRDAENSVSRGRK